MTVTDLLQVVPTRLIQAVRNKLLRACCRQLVNKTCYVQTISDLLEQLVASLFASSTLLQDDNNLFQTWQQLGTSTANNNLVDKL
jgi:flagellar biosynthesis component FlhA